MSINSTTSSIRGRMSLNSVFTLTGVPDKQYDPYKNHILAGVCQETSIESWIRGSTNYGEIDHPRKTRTKCKFDVQVKELINRTKITILKAQLRL